MASLEAGELALACRLAHKETHIFQTQRSQLWPFHFAEFQALCSMLDQTSRVLQLRQGQTGLQQTGERLMMGETAATAQVLTWCWCSLALVLINVLARVVYSVCAHSSACSRDGPSRQI